MFSIMLGEIRESRVETNMRFDRLEAKIDRLEGRMDCLEGKMDCLEGKMDCLEGRMDNLEREVKTTKQLVQTFKWDIDLLTTKQAKTDMSINRLEKRFES